MDSGDMAPRELLNYIDHLPSWSAFAEASAQDDEVAEMYLEAEDNGATVTPLLREWTPERSELVLLHEALQTLIAVTIKASGNPAEQPAPRERPQTARDRAVARRQDDDYEHLLALVSEAQARAGD